MNNPPRPEDDFARLAAADRPNVVSEFVDFLSYNKKWALLPILAVLAVFGVALALSTTAAAPFIYALF